MNSTSVLCRPPTPYWSKFLVPVPVDNLGDGLVVEFRPLEGLILALLRPGDCSGHDLLDLLRDPLRHLPADALRVGLAALLVARVARAGVRTDRLPHLDVVTSLVSLRAI